MGGLSAPGGLPLAVFLLLAGPAVGSFLALVAERLPRGEDVLAAPSRCRACGVRLGWRDLVPLVSWLALSGRCRHCGAGLPRSLVEAELAGLAAAALAVVFAPTPAATVLGALYLWCLLGLALCDLAAFRLPDALTGTLALAGLALAAADPARGVLAGLAAGAVGVAAFAALRQGYRALRGHEGLGMGDVKLMAGIGAGLGLAALPMVTLIAALAALALAGLARLRGDGSAAGPLAPVPFGAYLACAAAALWVLTA
ncbi:MAG: hypothetical protein CVT80_04015 [Alphaproteobacteria bacterium HGW-Alphaproteobacteria-2]|nr:MAG: hypothetical protein CVT80_04015 [Alphaproteobacteria bacterium HGW-Alphaproteobacteria-2]